MRHGSSQKRDGSLDDRDNTFSKRHARRVERRRRRMEVPQYLKEWEEVQDYMYWPYIIWEFDFQE